MSWNPPPPGPLGGYPGGLVPSPLAPGDAAPTPAAIAAATAAAAAAASNMVPNTDSLLSRFGLRAGDAVLGRFLVGDSGAQFHWFKG